MRFLIFRHPLVRDRRRALRWHTYAVPET